MVSNYFLHYSSESETAFKRLLSQAGWARSQGRFHFFSLNSAQIKCFSDETISALKRCWSWCKNGFEICICVKYDTSVLTRQTCAFLSFRYSKNEQTFLFSRRRYKFQNAPKFFSALSKNSPTYGAGHF